jgi:hypothetical protein
MAGAKAAIDKYHQYIPAASTKDNHQAPTNVHVVSG